MRFIQYMQSNKHCKHYNWYELHLMQSIQPYNQSNQIMITVNTKMNRIICGGWMVVVMIVDLPSWVERLWLLQVSVFWKGDCGSINHHFVWKSCATALSMQDSRQMSQNEIVSQVAAQSSIMFPAFPRSLKTNVRIEMTIMLGQNANEGCVMN